MKTRPAVVTAIIGLELRGVRCDRRSSRCRARVYIHGMTAEIADQAGRPRRRARSSSSCSRIRCSRGVTTSSRFSRIWAARNRPARWSARSAARGRKARRSRTTARDCWFRTRSAGWRGAGNGARSTPCSLSRRRMPRCTSRSSRPMFGRRRSRRWRSPGSPRRGIVWPRSPAERSSRIESTRSWWIARAPRSNPVPRPVPAP